jgi:hypothetical protein
MKFKVKTTYNTHESLQDTLSFFGVNCHRPYYISSGNPIFEYPSNAFRIDFYAICICTAGDINIEVDNQEYHISKNKILVSAPTTIIRFSQVSSDFRMKLLFFDKAFLLKHIVNPFFIEQLGLFKNSTFTLVNSQDKQIDKLLKLIDYLKEVTLRTTHFTADIIRTIIFNLLWRLPTNWPLKIKSPQKVYKKPTTFSISLQTWSAAQQSIQKVQYYADQLFISNKYLINIVKKHQVKHRMKLSMSVYLKKHMYCSGIPKRPSQKFHMKSDLIPSLHLVVFSKILHLIAIRVPKATKYVDRGNSVEQ